MNDFIAKVVRLAIWSRYCVWNDIAVIIPVRTRKIIIKIRTILHRYYALNVLRPTYDNMNFY